MTVDAEILQTVLQLPTPLKQEILHYAKYLVHNYAPSDSTETPQQKYRQAGTMKDMFVLPLPDDFDEPLEEMREYME